MDRQVGGLKTSSKNIAYTGLLIRHLVLPNLVENTKQTLDFISKELSSDVLVNLMDQYSPCYKAFNYEEISKSLSFIEYQRSYAYAKKLGLKLAN